MTTILFVCTGNVCRSPMAEVLMDRLVKDRSSLSIRCLSAGLGAMDGHPASAPAVEVMGELGLDLVHHTSLSLRPGLVDQADYVFTMTRQQQDVLHALYGESADKIHHLNDFRAVAGDEAVDIADPIGFTIDFYRQTRDEISRALPSILERVEHDRAAAVANPAPQAPGRCRVALAGDHGGVSLKATLVDWLTERGDVANDLGSGTDEPVDYPDYAYLLVAELLAGRADRGILICKSGIGMSIAANRYPGIRAALATDVSTARLSRGHNDSNVLVLSSNDLDEEQALAVVEAWLETEFEGGRHARRVNKIDHPPRLAGAGDGATGQPARLAVLAEQDPEVFDAVRLEQQRQQENIELIASENFTSPAILETAGSVLTNKYAEGYPGRRYYGGCEYVDIAEQLAIDRAKELFGAEHANVQPHSGSQANMAVYYSQLQYGDTILTMELAHGGHLTHGSPLNFSGKFYQVVHYGVSTETETIDYDALAKQAAACRPKMITAGASAYPRVIDFERMRSIADEVGALLFVDIAHIAGLVAAGVHPSPVPHADFVTTTTHKTLRGPRGGLVMCREQYAKDLNRWVLPGIQGGPLMHIIAAKAVCFREAMQPAFLAYQQQIVKNAAALAAGLERGGFRLVSGGTDNHLMLVDLRSKNLTGKIAEKALDQAGITVNKNLIPYDPEKPLVTSGIRIGTPAMTTRGMKEAEMGQIAELITEVLDQADDASVQASVKERVKALTARFPLPY